MRAGKSPAEMLAWRPWSTLLADLSTELSRTPADSGIVPTISPSGSPPPPPPGGHGDDSNGEDPASSDGDEVVNNTQKAKNDAAERLERTLVQFAVEPKTLADLVAILEASPLALVAGRDGAHVLILMDCNCFGESDSRPKTRSCPIGKQVFTKFTEATLQARQGIQAGNPLDYIQKGDVYFCIDGGKERRRQFTKSLTIKAGPKDPKRNIFKRVTLHCTEASVRLRRGRARGQVKVTQSVYIMRSAATHVPSHGYVTHGGSLSWHACVFFVFVQTYLPNIRTSIFPNFDSLGGARPAEL